MLLSCPCPEPPPCTFNLSECACYVRASGKLCGGKFADFISCCCCCTVCVYTTRVVHGAAYCYDDLRRAARLGMLRATSVAVETRGFMWHQRLLFVGFESAVAALLSTPRRQLLRADPWGARRGLQWLSRAVAAASSLRILEDTCGAVCCVLAWPRFGQIGAAWCSHVYTTAVYYGIYYRLWCTC